MGLADAIKKAAAALDAGGGDFRAPGTCCAACGKKPEDPARDLYRLRRPAAGVPAGVLLCFSCRWAKRGYAVMAMTHPSLLRGRSAGQRSALSAQYRRDDNSV